MWNEIIMYCVMWIFEEQNLVIKELSVIYIVNMEFIYGCCSVKYALDGGKLTTIRKNKFRQIIDENSCSFKRTFNEATKWMI